ncbi:hypothetical protein ACS0TY_032978 [Phlomoides rotata]
MKNLTLKAKAVRENAPGSPRASISPTSVGEIDTRAPFQSVKAAVTLFRDVSPKATSPVVKKSNAEERVLEKETQHQIMMRERGYYTNQLRSAEAAKAEALRELQRANTTLKLLMNKLEALTESKRASIKATEEAKITAKELEEQRARRAKLGNDAWKYDLNEERERYKVTTAELVSSKRELTKLKQDFDAASATKVAVFQKAEEEEQKAQTIQERESQLSREVDQVSKALEEVKLVSLQAQEEYSKKMEEKENALMSLKLGKEKADNEIRCLIDEYVPAETLQEKLEETMEAIKVLQDKLKEVQSSELYIIRKMASDLNGAKKALGQAIAEENSLRAAVDCYKHEIEEVKKKLPGSEKKALKAEAIVHKKEAELKKKEAELEKKEAELEKAMSGSATVIKSSIEKHLAEAEKAKHEAEDSKKNAKLLKQEAEAARIATKETEKKLKIALKEAEAAKAAEKLTEEQVHSYSKSESAEVQGSGSLRIIRLSVEEFESMNKKIKQLKNAADLKVATATAQAEAINAREKEISQQLAEMLKENEAIQSEIEDALKKARNAEAAKTIVESELQKWRQKELHHVGKPSKRKILISY